MSEDNVEVDSPPKTEEAKMEHDISVNKLLTLLKNLIINPIISEENVESRIKKFTSDLGEILLFLYYLALKLKDNAIKAIKQSNNEKKE
tara:strand:+ start:622 stop:888 length:267 start_codon:yes stop_codon:yes gene_type:complete